MNATYKGKPLNATAAPKYITGLERFRLVLIKENVIDEKGKLCIPNKHS